MVDQDLLGCSRLQIVGELLSQQRLLRFAGDCDRVFHQAGELFDDAHLPGH